MPATQSLNATDLAMVIFRALTSDRLTDKYRGAELVARDSRGLTAADHAARRGMEEVALHLSS